MSWLICLAAGFQLTAARRRLASRSPRMRISFKFQLTAARRRLGQALAMAMMRPYFNSQPREGGWAHHPRDRGRGGNFNSQPREGGWGAGRHRFAGRRHFNSQPREGGWVLSTYCTNTALYFNSQPREGGWLHEKRDANGNLTFQLTAARRRLVNPGHLSAQPSFISTHSRAKAAGSGIDKLMAQVIHFNSQPREGGWGVGNPVVAMPTDFNSQPREGGWRIGASGAIKRAYFNSQPREGGWSNLRPRCVRFDTFQLTAARRRLVIPKQACLTAPSFQLTAARRRLGSGIPPREPKLTISTHSRAKAAGWEQAASYLRSYIISTHSRAKAAGTKLKGVFTVKAKFQLTAARRRLADSLKPDMMFDIFQLTAARRRLAYKPDGPHKTALFQLTAARRRLAALRGGGSIKAHISTHSRAKAAGKFILCPI